MLLMFRMLVHHYSLHCTVYWLSPNYCLVAPSKRKGQTYMMNPIVITTGTVKRITSYVRPFITMLVGEVF